MIWEIAGGTTRGELRDHVAAGVEFSKHVLTRHRVESIACWSGVKLSAT